ncbi:MAG: hypothetical protein ACFCGT_23950 [Sandaracinaceae bacterium]
MIVRLYHDEMAIGRVQPTTDATPGDTILMRTTIAGRADATNVVILDTIGRVLVYAREASGDPAAGVPGVQLALLRRPRDREGADSHAEQPALEADHEASWSRTIELSTKANPDAEWLENRVRSQPLYALHAVLDRDWPEGSASERFAQLTRLVGALRRGVAESERWKGCLYVLSAIVVSHDLTERNVVQVERSRFEAFDVARALRAAGAGYVTVVSPEGDVLCTVGPHSIVPRFVAEGRQVKLATVPGREPSPVFRLGDLPHRLEPIRQTLLKQLNADPLLIELVRRVVEDQDPYVEDLTRWVVGEQPP